MLDRECHRLFQKQMPTGLDRRPADLIVQIRWQHDVDDVEFRLGQHLPVVGIDADVRKLVPGTRLAGLRAAHKWRSVRAGRLADRPGMVFAPSAVANQTETDRSRERHIRTTDSRIPAEPWR